jgi:hypothetical protein
MSTINLATLSVLEFNKLNIDELRDLKDQLLEKILSFADMKRTISDDMAQAMLDEQMNEYMYYVNFINVFIRKFYKKS